MMEQLLKTKTNKHAHLQVTIAQNYGNRDERDDKC